MLRKRQLKYSADTDQTRDLTVFTCTNLSKKGNTHAQKMNWEKEESPPYSSSTPSLYICIYLYKSV